jgi:hypothetical protein
MSDLDSERQYLIVVDYESDTQRKRAEYLLDNQDEGQIDSLQGLTRVASGLDVDTLYEELAAKVPEETIDLYDLEEVEATARKGERELHYQYDVETDRVTWAMESLLNRRESATREAGGDIDVWSVYTKKGRARIEYEIRQPSDGSTRLDIRVVGWGEAPTFLAEYIDEELEYMVF